MDTQAPSKNTILLTQLIFNFHAIAMQQMGKIADPGTGTIGRDLMQARMAIDMLDMLRSKTKGNLDETEERLLNHMISELRLNYVDEVNRPNAEPTESDRPAVTESNETAL